MDVWNVTTRLRHVVICWFISIANIVVRFPLDAIFVFVRSLFFLGVITLVGIIAMSCCVVVTVGSPSSPPVVFDSTRGAIMKVFAILALDAPNPSLNDPIFVHMSRNMME